MNLLILTQAVDKADPVLGFFHRWIEEFAMHCERVHVICLKEGEHALPENVTVHSLGKEHVSQPQKIMIYHNFLRRITYAARFYTYIWSLRAEYDAVFVHMNPEYLVLGGWLWRLSRKPVVLWYVHRQVTLVLRIAVLFASRIVTAAPESFGVMSSKLDIIGHGIDTARFASEPISEIQTRAPRIVAVGRITPIKNLDIAIQSIARLIQSGIHATLDVIGEPVTDSDREYFNGLKALVIDEGVSDAVSFLGAVTNTRMPDLYRRYDLSLNLCPTGGIDKAVLESMASGLLVVVTNHAFATLLGQYAEVLITKYRDPVSTADQIRNLLERSDIPAIQAYLRRTAIERADVKTVVASIMKHL